VNSTVFQNFNFDIPVTGNSLQVRMRVVMDAGTEELVFDNIRINGTSTLPVELVNFNTEKSESEVELTWQTVSELNNEGFSVLHSTDGESWNEIDFVPGFGTTTEMNAYQLLHRDPLNGMNYYRLQQVDIDGKTSLSDVRSVRFDRINAISVVPNPSKGVFFITLNTDLFGKEVVLQLLDTKGTVVLESKEIVELNNTISIDGSNLNSGVYLIRVSDATTTRIERMVIK
jgi:hypothetical protein